MQHPFYTTPGGESPSAAVSGLAANMREVAPLLPAALTVWMEESATRLEMIAKVCPGELGRAPTPRSRGCEGTEGAI